MDKPKRKYYKISLIVLASAAAVFVLGLAGSFWLGYGRAMGRLQGIVTSIQPVREHNDEYHFIYPLLLYNFNQAKSFFEDRALESKINAYVQTQYQSHNAEDVAVEIRDFGTLRWAGVNQDAQFQPGSMMKVIIMMGYFREAELNPALLQSSLNFSQAVSRQSTDVAFAAASNLKAGQSYTIEYLLKDMIADSDNGAETLLLDNADSGVLNEVYEDLGIASPDADPDYTISPDQYLDFLRILYNATYLSEVYSEQALSIMSQTTYGDGIVAGVPAGTPVAQKYGERVDTSGNVLEAVELSNCGIVYAPNNPYAICVMTKKAATTASGPADEQALANIIKNISSITYNYLAAQKN